MIPTKFGPGTMEIDKYVCIHNVDEQAYDSYYCVGDGSFIISQPAARRLGTLPPELVCAIHKEANGLPLEYPIPRRICIHTSISSNLSSLQSTLYIA